LRPRLRQFTPDCDARRERLELPDGDFLDLDWTAWGNGALALIVHGLEGSSRSPYARGLARSLAHHGWGAVVLNLRGCSGQPNRLARAYHSGETGDLDYVVRLLRDRKPDAPLAVIGYSAGGNILLKWLGERAHEAALAAAVAISVPYRLDIAVDALRHALGGVYERYFLKTLRAKTREKIDRLDMPLGHRKLDGIRSLRDFDESVTAPLHGFSGAEDYYERASCRRWLPQIAIPTLLIHAADDPFMTASAVPGHAELSVTTEMELYDRGGHVGFIAGALPWRPRYWLEERIPAFLSAQIQRQASGFMPPAGHAPR